jgi:hypothetical protein
MRQSSSKFGQLSQNHGQLSKNPDTCPNRRRPAVISGACADRVVAFLRRRHASTGAKIAEAVEADTGVSAGTVRKWLDRSSAPSFAACLALITAYGPEFLAAVFDRAPSWIDAAARAARRDQIESAIACLEAEAARLRDDGLRDDGRVAEFQPCSSQPPAPSARGADRGA